MSGAEIPEQFGHYPHHRSNRRRRHGSHLPAGQPDGELEVYRTIAELEPEAPAAYLAMGRIDEDRGNIEDARRQYLEGLKRSNFGPEETRALETVLETGGPAAFRQKQLQLQLVALNVRAQREYVSPDAVAAVYAGLGQKDEAFKWLEKGFVQRVPRLAWLKTGPAFAALHSDPRFKDLLRRMNYPD